MDRMALSSQGNTQLCGDYSTPPGQLNVDEEAALALAARLMDEDFDLAVSRRMRVDHGFAQPLQLWAWPRPSGFFRSSKIRCQRNFHFCS